MWYRYSHQYLYYFLHVTVIFKFHANGKFLLTLFFHLLSTFFFLSLTFTFIFSPPLEFYMCSTCVWVLSLRLCFSHTYLLLFYDIYYLVLRASVYYRINIEDSTGCLLSICLSGNQHAKTILVYLCRYINTVLLR